MAVDADGNIVLQCNTGGSCHGRVRGNGERAAAICEAAGQS
jgi:hypothetical protein